MKLTIDELKQQASVFDALEYAKSLYPELPQSPERISLHIKHTSQEALEYANALAQYEKDFAEYQQRKREYNESGKQINNIIEDFIKDIAGLDEIPEPSRSKVWAKAYEKRSEGYYYVYQELEELVDLFRG